jgi:membrane protein YqaA with SNARE-associated domain
MEKIKKPIKTSQVFLGILLGIIIVITILAALNPNFGDLFTVRTFFKSENSQTLEKIPFWVAVGFVMLVCFLGALIPFPIPYSIPITLFAAIWLKAYGLNAWLLIFVLVAFATLANTMGDLIDYLIGKGAQHILSKEDPELKTRWSKIILKKPKAIPGIIVLFGITPLPDSLLMVPLGIVEYDYKKTLFWMYIGRFIMMFIYALVGLFAFNIYISEEGPFEWLFGIIILYILWGLLVVVVKIKPKIKEKPEPTIDKA